MHCAELKLVPRRKVTMSKQRGTNGQYLSVDDHEDGSPERVLRSSIKKRNDRASGTPKRAKSAVARLSENKQHDPEWYELRAEVDKTCKAIYIQAKILAWITRIGYYACTAATFAILIYLGKVIMEVNVVGALLSLTFMCLLGKGEHFYAKVMDIIFPVDAIRETPRASFRLANSGFASADTILEFGFPLSINNPFILAVVFLSCYCLKYIIAYFHNMLVNVAELANAASPHQGLKERYGEVPDLI